MVSRCSTNINLLKLVSTLRKTRKDLWKRVALDLEKPRRRRRAVNLSTIQRYLNEGEIAVVPGKVLGDGTIKKKLKVAAFQFTNSAKHKIVAAGGSALSIQELLRENPEAKGVRILG